MFDFLVRSKKWVRGFTLGEVLIGAAVIVLITSVVLFNVSEVKKKARDAERVSDVSQIQLALRLYKEANGTYPGVFDNTAARFDIGSPFFGFNSQGVLVGEGISQDVLDARLRPGDTAFFNSLLAPYMEEVPSDPRSNRSEYQYIYFPSLECNINGEARYAVVLYVTKSERQSTANWGTTCGVLNPVVGTSNESYGIILQVLEPAFAP